MKAGGLVSKAHLIGAFGQFWDRAEVNWAPGSQPKAWQLIGYRGKNLGTLRLCNVRECKGFYILYDNHGPVYAGLARGAGGIGALLKAHNAQKTNWIRFSWFAFDDVVDAGKKKPGWALVKPRDALKGMTAEAVLRECEALLIPLLGLKDQNHMKFQSAHEWKQLTGIAFIQLDVYRKVSPAGFSDPFYTSLVSIQKA